MSEIKVHDKSFVPYLPESIILEKIKELAVVLDKDYAGKKPLFIAILNGSFMFTADLFKVLSIEAEICFIKLASYKGTKSTGNVITSIGLDEPLEGRHVVIIEDIVDTGNTLSYLIEKLKLHSPASIRVCSLLLKPAKLETSIEELRYVGFEIENEYVVGYGLDYKELGRNLTSIYRQIS